MTISSDEMEMRKTASDGKKKITSFQLGKERKMRFKIPWKKSKSVDYENSEQVDEFIQEVIERAKQEYLLECNNLSQLTNGHDLPPPVSDDEMDENGENMAAGEDRINIKLTERCHPTVDGQEYNSRNGGEADKNSGKGQTERKPLIEKTGNSTGACLQRLKTILCCHCICNTYEIT